MFLFRRGINQNELQVRRPSPGESHKESAAQKVHTPKNERRYNQRHPQQLQWGEEGKEYRTDQRKQKQALIKNEDCAEPHVARGNKAPGALLLLCEN